MESIVILMATYNGAKFIEQQLDSIITQTNPNWQLVIRDDGSSDDTLSIVNRYIEQDSRIQLIDVPSKARGACGNFSALFGWAKINVPQAYIMFCDQDDIWLSDKLEVTMQAMRALESNNAGKPCLIYGQLEFMDEAGNSTPGQIKMVKQTEFRYLLTYNYMYGCTMMLNKALVGRINEIPADAENHDYWIALAGTLGAIDFIDRPLLRYRKHDTNVSGNVKNNDGIKQRLIRHTSASGRLVNDIRKRLAMLVTFYKTYHAEADQHNVIMLKDYLTSYRTSRYAVMVSMLKNRILRYSLLQTLSLFYMTLFFYRQINPQSIIPEKL